MCYSCSKLITPDEACLKLFQWEYVDPTQLVRFTEYGRRILDLEIVVTDNFVHVPMWRWLEDRDHALLPRLRSLKISYRDASLLGKERSLFVLPTLLRSPFLHSVIIDMPFGGVKDKEGLGPVLHVITDSEISIKSLSLSGALFQDHIPYFAAMQKIQSVSLQLSDTSAALDVLTALTSVPHLKELSLDVSAFVTLPMTELKFPCLKELTLRGILQVVIKILAYTTIECLEGITIHTTRDEGPVPLFRLESQPPAMFQLGLSRFHTIRKVHVDWGGGIWVFARGMRNATSFVKPLLRLLHVEELVLTSLEPFIGFSDKDIVDLATAWGPQLTILRLEYKAQPTGSRPSFLCIDHLAKTCPRLTELSLTLKEGSLTYQTPDHVSDHALASLHLQHTDIMHHARVARYIDGLFPRLVRFDSAAPVDGQLVATVIFDACRPVRKDQEKRERNKRNDFGLFKPLHEIDRY